MKRLRNSSGIPDALTPKEGENAMKKEDKTWLLELADQLAIAVSDSRDGRVWFTQEATMVFSRRLREIVDRAER